MSDQTQHHTTLTGELVGGALQALLEAVDEALLLLDEQDRLVLRNARFDEFFGTADATSLADIRSRLVAAMATPEAYLSVLTEADPDGGEAEFLLLRPTRRRVRRRLAEVRGGDGRRLGRLISYRDVSHDAEVNRLKSEFVSHVSHELRTPMAAIKGFLGVMLDDAETIAPEQQRQFLSIAREQTERLGRLIDDLLDLSRIEAGRQPRAARRFSAAQLLAEVGATIQGEADRAGILFEVAVSEPAPELDADPDQLAQVLLNLLANALKFTPRGGRIQLAAQADEGTVRLSVGDSGPGIAAADLPYLFDRFYRGRGGESPGGSGLGLAIARELAELNGGSLEVDSRPGEGAMFLVRLPAGGAR